MSSSTIKPIVSVILSHKSRLKCITGIYDTLTTFDEPKIVKLTKIGNYAYVEYLEKEKMRKVL